MSKIKLDKRIENAMNAFFETEIDQSRFALTYTGTGSALIANETTFSEKAAKYSVILRELFMFGPGTLALFFATLMLANFYGTVGIDFGFGWGLRYFFVVFLTYAGPGSIKNLKNLAVPATVIVLSLAIVVIPKLLFGSELAGDYFWQSIHFFPFVLIAAKLVQSWVSEE